MVPKKLKLAVFLEVANGTDIQYLLTQADLLGIEVVLFPKCSSLYIRTNASLPKEIASCIFGQSRIHRAYSYIPYEVHINTKRTSSNLASFIARIAEDQI